MFGLFRKRKLVETGLLKGMTDVHAHLLPGVDDGIQTFEEAEEAVSVFLKDCRAHKIRKISIITGKGLHSEGGVGVLRDVVSDLLEKDGGISEKSNAPLQYGGSGAFWVILKKED